MHIVHEGQCPVRFITPRCQLAMQSTHCKKTAQGCPKLPTIAPRCQVGMQSTHLQTEHARLPKAAHHCSSLPGQSTHIPMEHAHAAQHVPHHKSTMRAHAAGLCSAARVFKPAAQLTWVDWPQQALQHRCLPQQLCPGRWARQPQRQPLQRCCWAVPLAAPRQQQALHPPWHDRPPPWQQTSPGAWPTHRQRGQAVPGWGQLWGPQQPPQGRCAPQQQELRHRGEGVTSQQPVVGQPTDPAGKKGRLTGCSRMPGACAVTNPTGACAVTEPTGAWLPWLNQM